MSIEDFNVLVATEEHTPFAQAICDEMAESAKARGTGIAKRTPEYVANQDACRQGGDCLSQRRNLGRFQLHRVLGTGRLMFANSGLIINPKFRKPGFGQSHQDRDFSCRSRCSKAAKLFGLTTGLAVMKINNDWGTAP